MGLTKGYSGKDIDTIVFKDDSARDELNELYRRRAKYSSWIASLDEKIDKIMRTVTVECGNPKCGAVHEIGNLVYLQSFWYVSPYGCTGGDYHNPGEGRFDCPTCGARTRLYNKPEIQKLNYKFASITNIYDR